MVGIGDEGKVTGKKWCELKFEGQIKNITGENEAKKWKWRNDIDKKWKIVHIYSVVNIKGMAKSQSLNQRSVSQT